MGKRWCLSIAAATAVVLLSTSAGAERYEVATAVGYRCTANAVVANQTLLVAGEHGSNTLRIVPTGADSVIAGWGVNVGPGIGPIAQQLVVFKPLGNGAYRKVAESRLETLTAGSNSFKARIPVKGGESVGLFGPQGTLACEEGAETSEQTSAVSLRSEGSTGIGGTATFATVDGLGTPLSSGVEPDHDGDGYGDYGQDRCEGSGSKGSDCPIGVHITRVAVKHRAILLEVTPKAFARIWLRGEFRWRERPERPGEQGGLRSVDSRTRVKEVGADNPEMFRVSIPPRILRRLDRLPRGKSMLAHISVFVTDRHGWENEELMHIALWSRR